MSLLFSLKNGLELNKISKNLTVCITVQCLLRSYLETMQIAEFSVRLSSMPDEWIPIRFIYFNAVQTNNDINIGNSGDLRIRGYSVQQVNASNGGDQALETTVRLRVCGFNALTDLVQFRWLQTAKVNSGAQPSDVWTLDDVKIGGTVNQTECAPVLYESFSPPLE